MESVDVLMFGLIDYAGLFPPAELAMLDAVGNYAEYLRSPDVSALGKFILPADRLEEFENAIGDVRGGAKSSTPWRISVLVKDDVEESLARLGRFAALSDADSPIALVAAIELPFSRLADVGKARGPGRAGYDTYVEVSAADDVDRAIPTVKAAGAKAKLRTGGVTSSAFPTTHRIVRFLRACCDSGVAFKATAGLHHPLRAEYALTYEPDSQRSLMFGFLNVFLAAAFVWNGADDATAARILDEADHSAFAFTDSAISWRGREISVNRIAEARRAFAVSFGSCSFREPVDELKLLLAGAARS